MHPTHKYPTLLPIAIVSLTFLPNHAAPNLNRARTSRRSNATTNAIANSKVRKKESSWESSWSWLRKWRRTRAGLRRKRVANVEIVRWVGVGVAEDVVGGKGLWDVGEGGRAIKSSSVVVLVLDVGAWSFDLGVAF
jgi:hypothetical protein